MKTLLSIVLLALALLRPEFAHAQSGCSIFTQGNIPTAAQWNSCLASKQDILNYTPLSLAGGVMTGPLVTFASAAGGAGFNIPPGFAPTSPNNGDMWTTSSGLFVRINGSTVGPLTGASGSSWQSTVPVQFLNGGGSQGIFIGCLLISPNYTTCPQNGAVRLQAEIAPGTPSGGYADCYVDSTTKLWSCKNDNGATVITIVPGSAPSNQFMTGISAGGALAFAQPSFTNLSGALASGQFTGSYTAVTSVKSSSPSGGIGYTTGAGGTVTQATSKATAATLNAMSGAITMNNAALAAGTIVSFTLTNSAIAATDTLVLNHISGGTIGSYTLNAQAGAGSAVINVRNNTAGSLSEAMVIQFTVIKGSNN